MKALLAGASPADHSMFGSVTDRLGSCLQNTLKQVQFLPEPPYNVGMPYADPERQRAFQRERMARLRADWMSDNGPCAQCGSKRALEVDHIDPETKISHKVWSWSLKRREKELAKCQVLCHRCHVKKTRQELLRVRSHGTYQRYSNSSTRCRCIACKAASARHKARWRKRTGRTQTFYNHRSVSQ